MPKEKDLKGLNSISDDLLQSVAGGKYRLERISIEDASIIMAAQKQTGDTSTQVVVSSNGIYYKVRKV